MNVLPIEVRYPTNVCTERQELQLMSYMRQLRVNVDSQYGYRHFHKQVLWYCYLETILPFVSIKHQSQLSGTCTLNKSFESMLISK